MEEAYLRHKEESENDFREGWAHEIKLLGRALDLSRLSPHELEDLRPLLSLLGITHESR